MFYKPSEGHGMTHEPFNAIIAPRPIGWISSIDPRGFPNLAPYSFFNAVAYRPPQVMFAATSGHSFSGPKDSVKNAEETGEFVVNLCTWDLREQMNASCVPAPSDVDEFEYAGLTKAAAQLVAPLYVAESPVHLECKTTQVTRLPSWDEKNPNTVVFGEVIGIHISDNVIKDGRVDTVGLQPIGRLGYLDYVRVTDSFSLDRPSWP